MRYSIRQILICTLIFSCNLTFAQTQPEQPVIHSRVGDRETSQDGEFIITNIGKKQQYDASQKLTFDKAVYSPKSAMFLPDGSRFYVNSLEGCCTVVYDAKTLERKKIISHRFPSGVGKLWAPPSGYYTWTHYPKGDSKAFSGKPVEMAFSHGGRYLWVPYYRRSFDINAQDPSAIAVIDTRTDSIVRMFETGPLPKMVSVSNKGDLLAITHWGDNTVGFIDISSSQPKLWHHLKPVTVGNKLKLNFPLDSAVNRDANSGYLLRGTVFMPGDRYLLVGCMAGGIAVIDTSLGKHLGFINTISNVRHLTSDHRYLYASSNIAGVIHKLPIDSIFSAVTRAVKTNSRSIKPGGLKSCSVGKGARTVELSPRGGYLFVACNFASRIQIVDTEKMKSVASIRCDSYPVGLCVSPDGSKVVVTSQGRKRHGGNAVNIFNVTYPKKK